MAAKDDSEKNGADSRDHRHRGSRAGSNLEENEAKLHGVLERVRVGHEMRRSKGAKSGKQASQGGIELPGRRPSGKTSGIPSSTKSGKASH